MRRPKKALKHYKAILRIKQPTLKQLMIQADAAFSMYIRERDNWTCVLCGSTKKPQCGHLIRRGKMSVRFDERNCACQCYSCNYRHEWFPEIYTNWFLQNELQSLTRYTELVYLAHDLGKKRFNKEELQTIIDTYKQKYLQLLASKKKSLKI